MLTPSNTMQRNEGEKHFLYTVIEEEEEENTQSESKGEQILFDELKQKVLWAMLTDDYDTFADLVDLDSKPDHQQRNRILRLLLQRQQFTLPGKEYRSQMPAVCIELLALFPPDPPADPRPASREMTYRDLLEEKLKGYRGYLVHIATALDRMLMLVRTMVVVYRHYGRPRAESLLMIRDSEGNTTLKVALSGPSRRTLFTICFMLCDMANSAGRGTFSAKCSLQRAVIHGIRSMYLCMDVGETMYCLLYFANNFCHCQDVSIFWPVYSGHLELLQYLVRDERRGVVDWTGLPALHWAVMLYSNECLTKQKRQTLEYLIHNCDLSPDHPRVSPNDTPTVWFKGHRMFGGTAVHFALYLHTTSPLQTCETEPDRPNSNSMHSSSGHPEQAVHTYGVETNTNTRLRGAPTSAGVFQMLAFLHKHGADFSLPDQFGKTPLDLLPPDADPQLVDKLITFQKPCDQQELCHSL